MTVLLSSDRCSYAEIGVAGEEVGHVALDQAPAVLQRMSLEGVIVVLCQGVPHRARDLGNGHALPVGGGNVLPHRLQAEVGVLVEERAIAVTAQVCFAVVLLRLQQHIPQTGRVLNQVCVLPHRQQAPPFDPYQAGGLRPSQQVLEVPHIGTGAHAEMVVGDVGELVVTGLQDLDQMTGVGQAQVPGRGQRPARADPAHQAPQLLNGGEVGSVHGLQFHRRQR
ncbi:hypothetical protein ACFY9A_37940 [Streptomyces rubradiris]|uniref:hypothetical protein n=1 Tax=Streptomyces rubradiris TaxID=285531 RepID=UPI0036E15A6F